MRLLHRPRKYWLLLACAAAFTTARAQSINIDLDVAQASPPLGGGAPSSTFGAAAGQPGVWNAVGAVGGGPFQLLGLDGGSTGASMTRGSPSGHAFGGAYRFEGNSGDYALLLNDAATVGDPITFTFLGLQPGVYDIYTYAVNIVGVFVPTPIEVPEAIASNMQIVTGPMPGNSFGFLITHSIHRVELNQGDTFRVIARAEAGIQESFDVNGFQIVAVPEPSSLFALAVLCLIGSLRVRR